MATSSKTNIRNIGPFVKIGSLSTHKLDESFPIALYTHYKKADSAVNQLHFHNCLEIGFCEKGKGVSIIADDVASFKAGDIIVLREYEPHLTRSENGTTSLWNWIFVDCVKLMARFPESAMILNTSRFGGLHSHALFSSSQAPQIAALYRQIIKEYEEKKAGYKSVICGQVVILLNKLLRLIETKPGAQAKPPEIEVVRAVLPAVRYINENLSEALPLEKLAEKCFVSTRTFTRLFRKAFGKSAQGYVAHQRISLAKLSLAATRKPVTEIAYASGFHTLSNFNKSFKKATGLSPREYRSRREP